MIADVPLTGHFHGEMDMDDMIAIEACRRSDKTLFPVRMREGSADDPVPAM